MTLKVPRDGTKFRSLAATTEYDDAHWHILSAIGVFARYARYKLDDYRSRDFSSLIQPDGLFYKKGDNKTKYTKSEVRKNLEGVDSAIDVDWSQYGGDPDAMMWDTLAVSAINARLHTKVTKEVGLDFDLWVATTIFDHHR